MKSGILPALALAFLTGPVARAELPPGSYDALRIGAQEALIIEVDSVTTKALPDDRIEVRASARVLSAERSKARLKKGDALTITYAVFDTSKGQAPPGPRPTPVLKKGGVTPAFLNAEEGSKGYEPAAYGLSFSMTPEM